MLLISVAGNELIQNGLALTQTFFKDLFPPISMLYLCFAVASSIFVVVPGDLHHSLIIMLTLHFNPIFFTSIIFVFENKEGNLIAYRLTVRQVHLS